MKEVTRLCLGKRIDEINFEIVEIGVKIDVLNLKKIHLIDEREEVLGCLNLNNEEYIMEIEE